MPMNISTKFHACIRMCMIIVNSRSTIRTSFFISFSAATNSSIAFFVPGSHSGEEWWYMLPCKVFIPAENKTLTISDLPHVLRSFEWVKFSSCFFPILKRSHMNFIFWLEKNISTFCFVSRPNLLKALTAGRYQWHFVLHTALKSTWN